MTKPHVRKAIDGIGGFVVFKPNGSYAFFANWTKAVRYAISAIARYY